MSRSLTPLRAVVQGSVLAVAAVLLAGCVSVAPPGATESPTLAAETASTQPDKTQRPCGSGDRRPRCQTPTPQATAVETILVPTESPSTEPTVPAPSTAPPATPVPPGISVFPATVDFGSVQIGTTASVPMIIVNGDATPFGPINMFGGAPPKPEFNASQDCQGTTLAAGGFCTIFYTYTPSATGPASDTSDFTVSPTSSQGDGINFSIPLQGCGITVSLVPCLTVLEPL